MSKDFTNNPNEACIQDQFLKSIVETNLLLPEFKILDVYLARLNSNKQEKRTVKFEEGEIEQLLGVSRLSENDLVACLVNLFQVIEIKDESTRKGFTLINLFETTDAKPNKDGLWQVALTCTESAREYIFTADNIGYLRYRLQNVIALNAKSGRILFLYLMDNRSRKKWTVSFDDLRNLLKCTAKKYRQFELFDAEILKNCQSEINAKTDLQFSYNAVKHEGRVSDIEFTVTEISEKLENGEPITTEKR